VGLLRLLDELIDGDPQVWSGVRPTEWRRRVLELSDTWPICTLGASWW
jgi:hypothetical protein